MNKRWLSRSLFTANWYIVRRHVFIVYMNKGANPIFYGVQFLLVEDVLDLIWMSFPPSIYILCPDDCCGTNSIQALLHEFFYGNVRRIHNMRHWNTGLVSSRVRSIKAGLRRWTLVIAVVSVDAYPFLAISYLICHLVDTEIRSVF